MIKITYKKEVHEITKSVLAKIITPIISIYLIIGLFGLYSQMFTTPNYCEYVVEQGKNIFIEPVWYLVLTVFTLWKIIPLIEE